MAKLLNVFNKFYKNYLNDTPNKLKIVDAYLMYVLLTGIIQFVYCLLVGTFPFNSFLAGFISTVSSFVLGTSLRIQINDQNKQEFKNLCKEKAFAEFIFAHVILHLIVFNFIG